MDTELSEQDVQYPGHPMFDHAESVARRRVGSGRAGVELVAVLLDLLDAAREQRPVTDEAWQRWARAAGVADLGPELAS